MQATVQIEIDLHGWYKWCKRMVDATDIVRATEGKLEYAGVHKELNVSNSRIASAEFARAGGDKHAIFPLLETDREKPAELLVTRLKNIADGASAQSIKGAFKTVVRMLRAAVYRNVLKDRTTGPARTTIWNLYKAAHFKPPTPKMVATRVWLNSLTATVDGQTVGKESKGGGFRIP